MPELYQTGTGALTAAQMTGVETKTYDSFQQYLWASMFKEQTSDLKVFNLFHRQAAGGAVNVTCFWWKHFIKLASLLCFSIYRMKREYVAANTNHAAY